MTTEKWTQRHARTGNRRWRHPYQSEAAGICGGDLHYYKGTLKAGLGKLPVILGHEFAGTIAKKGKDVGSLLAIR